MGRFAARDAAGSGGAFQNPLVKVLRIKATGAFSPLQHAEKVSLIRTEALFSSGMVGLVCRKAV
jgi:hypothetical protein